MWTNMKFVFKFLLWKVNKIRFYWNYIKQNNITTLEIHLWPLNLTKWLPFLTFICGHCRNGKYVISWNWSENTRAKINCSWLTHPVCSESVRLTSPSITINTYTGKLPPSFISTTPEPCIVRAATNMCNRPCRRYECTLTICEKYPLATHTNKYGGQHLSPPPAQQYSSMSRVCSRKSSSSQNVCQEQGDAIFVNENTRARYRNWTWT